MSGISTKIYGNDMALDVKNDFCQLYGIGKTVDEINEYIFKYQPDDDDEEACAFWTALALIEWEYGVLNDYVKGKAQYIIENKSDVLLFINKEDAWARKIELEELLKKINTVNQTPEKPKKPFVYRTSWHEGDIYALPLYEKYVYIHVCAISREKNEIKELEEDKVFVRIFDKVSAELLDVKFFKPKPFSKLKYKNLDSYGNCITKMLWCVSAREKNALESKLIYIGNIPTKREIPDSVYTDFQFKKIESTLIEVFNMDNR
ncbi:MAG: hypothetical protein NC420_13835 [Eubacterium sp.]|nr:hypothetical protein [Eubacterium sp.]